MASIAAVASGLGAALRPLETELGNKSLAPTLDLRVDIGVILTRARIGRESGAAGRSSPNWPCIFAWHPLPSPHGADKFFDKPLALNLVRIKPLDPTRDRDGPAPTAGTSDFRRFGPNERGRNSARRVAKVIFISWHGHRACELGSVSCNRRPCQCRPVGSCSNERRQRARRGRASGEVHANACLAQTICAVKEKIRWQTPAWTPSQCGRIADAVAGAAKRHDLSPSLLLAVMVNESDMNEKAARVYTREGRSTRRTAA